MEIRTVTAGRGWQWIKLGVALFQKSPLQWVMFVGVLFLAIKVLLLIPLIGLLVMLVLPVLLVGMMEGCRALEYGKPLAFGYLLSGFVRNTGALLTLGGISLAGNLLVVLVISGIGGDAINAVLKFMAQQKVTPENVHEIRDAASKATLSVFIGWALSIPLMMALWFAPLLTYFNNLTPGRAMLYSLAACWRNLSAFLVYGVVVFTALMLVTPIAMAARILDLSVWLLAPVVIPTIYTAYKDIFDIDSVASGAPPAEPGNHT
ncbi:MAG: BPSS1780 family membrane protein [Burkholderiales bacterium]